MSWPSVARYFGSTITRLTAILVPWRSLLDPR